MNIPKHLYPRKETKTIQHLRRLLWPLVALVLAVLLTRGLTAPLFAQSADVTPTATPSAESEPEATAENETISLLPPMGSINADQIKALVRARILALIRARMMMSSTQQTVEHTLLLPMVMRSAATPVAADTVTNTVGAEDAPQAQAEAFSEAPAPAPIPQPTPDGVVRAVQVPILMYHYLSTPPAGADIYRRDLSVTPSLFAEHLDRLLAEGYTTIRLDDLLLNLTQGTPLPEKPVIITFDDGYRDNYDNAFPLLKDRDMTAAFFIVTDFIDEERPEYLSWDMVREMYAGGMAIESHGRNHASLAARDDDYLVWQALGSMETIEYELGVRPRFVSYPA
ncbi:MAG: polysaccharide deacetylase family protein, partial [Caldilineaceae bacterium]|nr:polysaccharide deacetylase family protein [Caldilineaceae bacterium]